MEPISFETIDTVFNEMAQSTPEKAIQILDDMRREQPYIFAYLHKTADRDFSLPEKELFIFLGVCIWQAMTRENSSLPKVLPVMIGEMEKMNAQLLDTMEDMNEKDFSESIHKMMESYPQPYLLHYINMVLTKEEEEGEVNPEDTGLIFVYLKTIIDAFQKVSEIPTAKLR